MLRHVFFMLSLIAAGLAAAIAMVPGEREQSTMLVRDSRNQEALAVIEARYHAGVRETAVVMQYYKLLMSLSEVAQATAVLEEFTGARPYDQQSLALLAKHYGDTQNRRAELRTLETLFEVSPSTATAHVLLTLYRLDGAFDREERLLRKLLAERIITADDAERLGLLLYARGDLQGAREALTHFDAIADPEQMTGRLALADLLSELGEGDAAARSGQGSPAQG